MKLKSLLFIIFLAPLCLSAQYSTPGTGLTYTFADLVLISDGVITESGGNYTINDSLTVVASDTLLVDSETEVLIAPEVVITVQGALQVDAAALFTRLDVVENYGGFRFEEGSSASLSGATFELGGGIRVLTEEFTMQACTVRFMGTTESSGGAIGLSSGKPTISFSHFEGNQTAAIGSSANIAVAPTVANCTFTNNNTLNQNRPQINLGPSGDSDTTKIINNTVIGNPLNDNVGGIAVASLVGVACHAIISGNEVVDNRYGIAVIGNNIYSEIFGNLVLNNNIADDPLTGGSGLNFNSSGENSHLILNNIIEGNLWGITTQGNAMINLGDLSDGEIGAGGNTFSENGNNGEIFALYNNTPNPISAEGNCWIAGFSEATLEDIEEVIFHEIDAPELGFVNYDEGGCFVVPGVKEIAFEDIAVLFPNPTREIFHIQLDRKADYIELIDKSGRTVLRKTLGNKTGTFSFDVSNLAAGIYLTKVGGADFIAVGRLAVQ